MKIVHICMSDVVGGASVAAFRLNAALNEKDIESQMVVINRRSSDKRVVKYHDTLLERFFLSHLRSYLDLRKSRSISIDEHNLCSAGTVGVNLLRERVVKEADIIHLHWINAGYASLKSLSRLKHTGKPIVWTFHDMWAFTGVCHYNGTCTMYRHGCDDCGLLKRRYRKRLAKKIWIKKKRLYHSMQINPVGCSAWMTKCAKESGLFKNENVTTLPNCIDLKKYKMIDRSTAKIALGLNKEVKYILFGAINAKGDVRKGYNELKEAIEQLSKHVDEQVELLVFGTEDERVSEEFALKTNSLGFIRDERVLMLAYNAADVFVVSSIQDNLPNTMLESFACGTPITAFNIGGIPDIIEHKCTGFLAEPYNLNEMAKGIRWCLVQDQSIRARIREKAERCYSYKNAALGYIKLYEGLLQ